MDPKPIYMSKTVWVNVLSGVVLFLEGQQVIDILPPNSLPYVAAAVFAINIILRYITVQPVTLTGKPSSF